MGLALIGAVEGAEMEGVPKAGEFREAAISPGRERTLKNGMRVIAVERPGLPLLCAELLIKSGAETDPLKQAGLAHLTANLLTQGTTTRSAPEIAREIESLGAKLEIEARWDATTLKLTGLSDYAGPALLILADVIRRPAFLPAELERIRHQTLDELRLAFEAPGTVAHLAASRAALGFSPYAHPEGGTLASVSRIARKDIAGLHQRAYRPPNAILVVAGAVAPDAVFEMAEKAFGDWNEIPGMERPGAASAPSPAPPDAAPPKPRALLIDMPNAGQAAVFVAGPTIARTADDYFAGKVANALLGGGYSSRLNQEVRLKRGLSYGAASALETRRFSGFFAASAQTKNESAAEVVRVMRAEIDRLASELQPADYLKTRKAVLSGAFSRDLETNEGHAKRLAELALHGLPLDLLERTLGDIEAVDAEALRRFAERHLSTSAMSVVVAGRAKEAAGPLRELFPQLEVIPQSALDLEAASLRKAARR